MQKEVLRECRKNLAFTLEPISGSSTNSKAASSGMWNAKREMCRLQARNAVLEVQCGDQKQEIAQLKEKKERIIAKKKKIYDDYKSLADDCNQLVDDHNQLVHKSNKLANDYIQQIRQNRVAIMVQDKYVKAHQDANFPPNFLKHWVRDLKEERASFQRQIAAFQRREAILLALVPTATADRGYHTPARRGRGRGASRT